MHWFLISVHIVIMAIALVHALVYKRDHRAALGWIGVIIVFPIAGPLIYFLFGINRVRSAARRFSGHYLPYFHFGYKRSERPALDSPVADEATLPAIMQVGRKVTHQPLASGNRIEVLINGEDFFPRLLEAIAEANECVLISSYLFSRKGIAGEIIQALGHAVSRGVRVCVLVDGAGVFYSGRMAVPKLRKAGVELAEFMPLSLFPPSFGINLRNHRKITVIDGRVAFFGGINIDPRHMVGAADNRHPTRDVHFSASGPVVLSLQQVFARDWWMATRQTLDDLPMPSVQDCAGDVGCRVIDDGPDENLDALAMTLLGVITAARHSLMIMTPYFLPARELIAAIQSASLRGVRVQIVIPERSNLPFVDWATRNMLWELVLWDVEVYAQPAPFAHSKLLAIDGCYVMGGSANIDPRSLRLNFELGVEMFNDDLARTVEAHIEEAVASSRRITMEELDNRPLPIRIRDAIFWLFSSYL